TGLIRDHDLTPMLNSAAQVRRHLDALPGHGFGIQIDTGMHRLGMTPGEWAGLAPEAASKGARLVMSHLACADEAGHAQNPQQLATFRRLTDGIALPRSLAATGGILLGPDYHFDLTRPGIGLYGGQPFNDARPVVRLSLPVIQIRDVAPGDAVGYAASWRARRPARIATLAAGYADGLLRHMSNRAQLWHGDVACPLVGRVSMDLITVDVTAVGTDPEALDILCPAQSADALGVAAGTVGYEILTSLGPRYARSYTGGR
ncbi:MAG: alanine racemase C-terminal domain-containing protein, partial [Albidovulum sp.]